ncbi:MAG: molybdopterin molybdotransferase MoeA [Trichocoleus desertorum ATA4-8-CV12]|jgi:molybdopterin molybdotransferase|nr:molybdopterin molybdotransferase MoeA [Trichocoleus desertorum ATA4-8-CV12]
MLPVKQAEALILDLVSPLSTHNPHQTTEVLDLLSASGRILAAPVTSALDFPHWDNSAMDGYAVRFADVRSCSAEQPVTLEIVEEIPAGYQPQKLVQPGQAARILTGAMMPAGADTVVMQERTQRQGDRVTILEAPEFQAFVRQRAAFYQAGTPLLQPGISLNAPEIAVLAAAQCAQVTVYRQLRVAILSTGSELVAPDQPLQPGQIVDSNQYALAALVKQMGAEPVLLGVVPDEPEALKQAIAQAIATVDVVLSSGGVSVGDYDYVDEILAALGAEIHIRAVAVKPGKPLTVATAISESAQPRSVLYFGLPGNPVSALVTFWRFVQPALRKLSGLASGWEPTFIKARTHQNLRSDGKRESYLWGHLQLVNGEYEFRLAGGSHSSGNLINLAQTNSLAVLPVGQTAIAAGAEVLVMQVD